MVISPWILRFNGIVGDMSLTIINQLYEHIHFWVWKDVFFREKSRSIGDHPIPQYEIHESPPWCFRCFISPNDIHIIFILYSYYIHIIFILYSYYIHIIFILYSYYIHIIFILYSYYIHIISYYIILYDSYLPMCPLNISNFKQIHFQDLEALYSILTELERVNQCLAETQGVDDRVSRNSIVIPRSPTVLSFFGMLYMKLPVHTQYTNVGHTFLLRL